MDEQDYMFVDPETVRVKLFGGEQWVEIKRALTFGDEQLLSGATMAWFQRAEGRAERDVAVDWQRAQLQKLIVWILDWSFKDKAGKPVKVTPEAIAALQPKVALEIGNAINKHVRESADPNSPSGDGNGSEGASSSAAT